IRSVLILTIFTFAPASVSQLQAQSMNQELPTPVFSNEINGTIPVLDLGDSRSTRHYYAFEAMPGDLIVTVNSRNLNGDVDVFTAVTFRPLTKITIYAGTIPPEVTKSLYFRARQIVILRVEARTPNDDAGAYRITLGGSFQPFSGGIPVAENAPAETEPDKRDDNNLQRLSSVGATIPRPPGEVAVEEPKPAETEVEKPAEEKPVTPAPSARRNTPRSTSRRNPRGRTPPRTTRTAPAKPQTAKPETPTTEAEQPKAEAPTPTPTEETKAEEKPATEKPSIKEGTGARLVIEQTDGTRIDRPMSTIRRVIVETNAIVIVLRTGRIERIAMSSVARMAIEP
ncbi:MAG TPA: hypothetical protein VGW32_10725, partial [Pyrinomonadaceae bacterium]|nr:hypothetical protein [Pyrinomonadaceae bacterium]